MEIWIILAIIAMVAGVATLLYVGMPGTETARYEDDEDEEWVNWL